MSARPVERDGVMPYSVQQDTLTAESFLDILRRSGLADRRPSDLRTLSAMLENADILLTARDTTGTLVGVARSITDYAYCTYLSDLAVDREHQGKGLGRQLIDETHRIAGKETSLILLAAPNAVSYYEHIAMDRHPACFLLQRTT